MRVDEEGHSPRDRGTQRARRRAAARRRALRLFVAIYPPLEIAQRLLEAVEAEELPEHRSVPPEKVHLTAQFLGDVDERELDRVKESVKRAALGVFPFRLQPLHLAPLPESGPAKLVAAVTDAPSPLLELHERLVQRLAARKRKSRPFLPHLTLCRFDTPDEVDVATALTSVPAFDVDAVHLMRSRLGPEGAHHRGLARLPLG